MSRLHAEKFRLLGQRAGERVRWLRAVEGERGPNGQVANRQGKYFIEQHLPADVRVRVYTNYQDVQDEEFGTIKVAQTRMRFMPDEIQPLRDDRFLCLERSHNARQTLEVTNERVRPLLYPYVDSIAQVVGQGQVLRPSQYALQNGALVWIGAIPTEAVTVFYSYLEAYEFLGEGLKQGPADESGVRLPAWMPVRLLPGGTL